MRRLQTRFVADISKYTENFFLGMTPRQTVCGVAAIVIIAGGSFLLHIPSFLSIILGFPVLLIGFFQPEGMPLEKYLACWIDSKLKNSYVRYYEPDNIVYDFLWRGVINGRKAFDPQAYLKDEEPRKHGKKGSKDEDEALRRIQTERQETLKAMTPAERKAFLKQEKLDAKKQRREDADQKRKAELEAADEKKRKKKEAADQKKKAAEDRRRMRAEEKQRRRDEKTKARQKDKTTAGTSKHGQAEDEDVNPTYVDEARAAMGPLTEWNNRPDPREDADDSHSRVLQRIAALDAETYPDNLRDELIAKTETMASAGVDLFAEVTAGGAPADGKQFADEEPQGASCDLDSLFDSVVGSDAEEETQQTPDVSSEPLPAASGMEEAGEDESADAADPEPPAETPRAVNAQATEQTIPAHASADETPEAQTQEEAAEPASEINPFEDALLEEQSSPQEQSAAAEEAGEIPEAENGPETAPESALEETQDIYAQEPPETEDESQIAASDALEALEALDVFEDDGAKSEDEPAAEEAHTAAEESESAMQLEPAYERPAAEAGTVICLDDLPDVKARRRRGRYDEPTRYARRLRRYEDEDTPVRPRKRGAV